MKLLKTNIVANKSLAFFVNSKTLEETEDCSSSKSPSWFLFSEKNATSDPDINPDINSKRIRLAPYQTKLTENRLILKRHSIIPKSGGSVSKV